MSAEMERKIAAAEAALAKLQAQDLSLLRLAEPLASLDGTNNPKARSSDASTEAGDNPSPASLAADLGHYKELFAKLRFSYVEQVTKEKFLRAIVGDPPQIVEPAENAELESRLSETKAELKQQKQLVAAMVDELETLARDLGERYEHVSRQRAQLRTLPAAIADLQSASAGLRAQLATSPDGALSLPLGATQELVRARQDELGELQKQLKALQQQAPRRARELERLESELKPLEVQRAGTLAAAEEARRRKDDAGRGLGDDIELKGRWYRSAEAVLKDALEA